DRPVHDMARRVAQTGSKVCVHQKVDLDGSAAEYRRPHQLHNVPNPLMPQVPAGPPGEASAPDGWQLKTELKYSAEDDPDRHTMHRADAKLRAEPVTDCKPEYHRAYVEK